MEEVSKFWLCLRKICLRHGYKIKEGDYTVPFLFLLNNKEIYLPRGDLEEKIYLLYAFLFNEIIEFEIPDEVRLQRIKSGKIQLF